MLAEVPEFARDCSTNIFSIDGTVLPPGPQGRREILQGKGEPVFSPVLCAAASF